MGGGGGKKFVGHCRSECGHAGPCSTHVLVYVQAIKGGSGGMPPRIMDDMLCIGSLPQCLMTLKLDT